MFSFAVFLQGVVFCPIMDGARNFAQYSQGPVKRGFLELKIFWAKNEIASEKPIDQNCHKQLSGAHPVPLQLPLCEIMFV